MRSQLTYGTLAVGALALLVYAAPAVAHHAFDQEFDRDAPMQLTGPIVRLEWVNPHTQIHVQVTNPDGSTDVWMVEGTAPNVLQRRGLRRECLPIGTVLIVDGYQTKHHTLKRANGRDVTIPDGTKFFLGTSGIGAPDDGRDVRGRAPGRC